MTGITYNRSNGTLLHKGQPVPAVTQHEALTDFWNLMNCLSSKNVKSVLIGQNIGLNLFNENTCPSGHISGPTQLNVSQSCFYSPKTNYSSPIILSRSGGYLKLTKCIRLGVIWLSNRDANHYAKCVIVTHFKGVYATMPANGHQGFKLRKFESPGCQPLPALIAGPFQSRATLPPA